MSELFHQALVADHKKGWKLTAPDQFSKKCNYMARQPIFVLTHCDRKTRESHAWGGKSKANL